MAKVNQAPFNAIPQEWAFDPDIGPFIRELMTQIWQLRARTGGYTDVIETTVTSTSDNSGQFALVQDLVGAARDVSVQSTVYTTANSEIVICNNAAAITVTLNASPDDEELVSIKRTDGTVTIAGNGKTIDGKTAQRINVKYASLDLLYTVETDSWSII